MKTVYLLGAGAAAGYQESYIGENSPVSKNFFTKAARVMNVHKIKDRYFNDDGQNYHHLFSFIEQLWGVDRNKIGLTDIDINMEEVLTLLHIELQENPHSLELKRACREYMLLMSITFDKILYGNPCPYHQKIAASLKPGDVVISFNYELLMDNALLLSKRWFPHDGYGVHCKLLSADSSYHVDSAVSEVALLKLHGSFNWLYCSECRQLFTAAEGSGENLRFKYNHFDKISCVHQGCRHSLQPIIIPPTMMKNYETMPFTHQLWRKARQALCDADHIVIIGYSFPPTDFRSKWLFRKAMQQSTRSRKITVVNHATGERLQTLLRQYSSLMRTKEVASYPTIADYAAVLN